MKFNENPLFQADGRTDRHDETNSRFSQFCKHAQQRAQPGHGTYRNYRHASGQTLRATTSPPAVTATV